MMNAELDCAIQSDRLRTVEVYDELQRAFTHFNEDLFEGALPHCMITLQRQKQTCGYYSHQRFVHSQREIMVDEIAMNPVFFATSSLAEVMSTLVHEMVHQWQFVFGKPSRRSYHNAEWADKMEAIGLMPSSTGHPGGRRTGEKISDYIISDGKFEQSCNVLLSKSFVLSWLDRFPETPLPLTLGDDLHQALPLGSHIEGLLIQKAPNANKSNRVKFTCPNCGSSAWGKPSLRILCGEAACGAIGMEGER